MKGWALQFGANRDTPSKEKTAMGETSTHVPVTYERCEHIGGPFYHGTRSALEARDELVPGYGSNFQEGRVSNHIYFTALVDTAPGERSRRQRWPGAGSGDASMS
jgi:hypothetical protein